MSTSDDGNRSGNKNRINNGYQPRQDGYQPAKKGYQPAPTPLNVNNPPTGGTGVTAVSSEKPKK
jgi:hypothetical protein